MYVCVRCDHEHILCHLNVAQIIQLKEKRPRGAPGSWLSYYCRFYLVCFIFT